MTRDSAELLAEQFPDLPMKRPVSGRETLLSIDKACRMLGYEPKYNWQDELAKLS